MPRSQQDLPAAAECLIFVSRQPVSAPRLAAHLEVPPDEIPAIIDELAERLRDHGVYIVEIAGGYSLATRPEYAPLVQAFLEPPPERLSVQALETLAIIAYRQPITRPEIDEVRGVNSSSVIQTLLEKNLIRLTGRKDAPGRPFLLETTPDFLSAFGLKDLDELPQLPELQIPQAAQQLSTSERLSTSPASSLPRSENGGASDNEEDEEPSADLSAD